MVLDGLLNQSITKIFNLNHLTIYLKTDNTLKYSTVKNNFLKVGDVNGFGYKVIAKYIFYKDYFVTKETFWKLYYKDEKKHKIKCEKKEKIYKLLEVIRDVL